MEHSSGSKRPAVRALLLFIVGLIVSGGMTAKPSHVLALTVILLLIAVFGFRRTCFSPCASLALHLAFVLIGLFWTTLRRSQVEEEVLSPSYHGERVTLDGRIESEPIRKSSRSEMVVRTRCIKRGDTEYQLDRRVLVQVARTARWENTDSLQIGDHVCMLGYLETLPGARNPGDFDYGRYLALNGIQGFMTVRDSNAVSLSARATDLSVSNYVALAQNSIYTIFDRYHGPEEASFLKGVVFGYRGDLSAEIKQSFMDTGTIHILAVSGSNVVVVALIFFSVVGFFRLSSRIATALTLAGLIWYMVITGLSPSVIRATIMGGVLLIGSILGRKGDIYNTLAVAALVMLLWDPLFLFDVGFQLSFAAVISIVYFYPRLEHWIELIPGRIAKSTVADSALKLFAVSMAAQIGTMPFTGYYFGRVSLIAVVANLLVVPLSGLNTLLGFATIAFSAVSNPIASCYAALNDILVSLLLKFVKTASKVPYAYVETLNAGLMTTVIYYVAVGVVFNVGKPRFIARTIIVLLLALNVFLYKDALSPKATALEMTVIDVGQGDAILLELPNRKHILVDAGPRYVGYDVGERIILPFLRKSGITSLDAVILSHAHDDHVGGCRSILENIRVLQLVVGDTAAPTRLSRETLDAARRTSTPIKIAHAGEVLQFDPTTRIFVLQPAVSYRPNDLNDQSVVLKVVYGSSSVLLPGDASQNVEDALIHRAGSLLASTVLKSPHHGALTASSEEFLRVVEPSLVVISVGRLNRFHHPSPIVMSRYQRLGIMTKRTDLDGALVLRSDGKKFDIVDWRRSGVL